MKYEQYLQYKQYSKYVITIATQPSSPHFFLTLCQPLKKVVSSTWSVI